MYKLHAGILRPELYLERLPRSSFLVVLFTPQPAASLKAGSNGIKVFTLPLGCFIVASYVEPIQSTPGLWISFLVLDSMSFHRRISWRSGVPRKEISE